MPDPTPPKGVVLVTRPEPGASDTARRLGAAGYCPVVAPVMTIGARSPQLPSAVQAVVVTSANALLAPCPALHRLRLFAVGDATAASARAVGFAVVHSAGADAAALLPVVLRHCRADDGPVLLLSGAGQGAALAAALRGAGLRVIRRVTYATTPVRALPAAARTRLGEGSTGDALFFSPGSARAFVRLFRRALADRAAAGWQALAISDATADALAPLPWRSIRVASAPNQDALLALLP